VEKPKQVLKVCQKFVVLLMKAGTGSVVYCKVDTILCKVWLGLHHFAGVHAREPQE